MKFKVTFIEKTPRGTETFVRECDVPNEEEVIKIYGLEEDDIVNYSIKKL